MQFSSLSQACRGEALSDGGWSIRTMGKTFRKRSVKTLTGGSVLSSDVLTELQAYTPPLMVASAELEAIVHHSVRSWTVSVVQASVLFIHFGIGGVMDLLALDCAKIHKAVVTVQRAIYKMQGCIHRFTVDDKGCVMKVVFGAHMPHEDQPYRALLAALQLRQALSLQGIQPALGVASGVALIGPVGTNTRQEFTVHGDRIILAARLMQLASKLGGMVLCDEVTHAATCDELRFVTLRPAALKGRSELMRPYRPVASSELLEKPVLQSKSSSRYCLTGQESLALDACRHWTETQEPDFQVVSISGEHGAGKTQLLMQARELFEQHCKVLHVRCRSHEQSERGALVRRLFAQLCGYDVWPSLQHITPMLSTSPAGRSPHSERVRESRESRETALRQAELSLLLSHAESGTDAETNEPWALEGSRRARRRRRLSSGYEAAMRKAWSLETAATDHVRASSPPSAREVLRRSTASSYTSSNNVSRIVLILDDMHFADDHSCQMFEELAAAAPNGMLLLTACRESAGSLAAMATTSSESTSKARVLPGHRLIHALASQPSTTAVPLLPFNMVACERLASTTISAGDMPNTAIRIIARRSGGIPVLVQAIAQAFVDQKLLQVDESSGTASLSGGCQGSSLDAAATAAIVEKRHSVLCVKLSQLSMIQQLILKTMSLLPKQCSAEALHQALPVSLDLPTLKLQLAELRERQVPPPARTTGGPAKCRY